jgi:thioredoxin reductase (NADPH)
MELTSLMHQQALQYGMEVVIDEVTGIKIEGEIKTAMTSQGELSAKALIIAGGSERQKLNVPGEKEYTGKGVSYCATCDAPFFRGKRVAIVGGGNAALYEALHIAKFASRVSIIHRRDQFRATPVVQDKVFAEPNIDFIWNTVVKEIQGDTFVRGLKIVDVKSGKESLLEVDGVFIAIGLIPNTAYLKGTVDMDEKGSVIVNDRMETSVPGIFAAGDIRSNSIRQVIAAAGDGAVAAVSASNFIENQV